MNRRQPQMIYFKKVFTVTLATLTLGLANCQASLAPDPKVTQKFMEEQAKREENTQKKDAEKRATHERVDRLLPGGATIAIVVNKDIITKQDIHDRSLLILLTSGMESTPKNIEAVKEQVCKSLIDEKIQLQIAKEQKIIISDAELKIAVEGIAKENNMNIEQLRCMFADKGISLSTLEHRLKAQIGWERTVREAMSGMVQITEADEAKALEDIKANHTKDQFELFEIFLRIDNPAFERNIQTDVNRIHQQLQDGASFKVLAQQFSQGATKAGYMGWLTKDQLDTPLLAPLESLKVGGFSAPIRVSNGYKIIFLQDVKKAGAASFGQTQITFKRVSIPFDEVNMGEDGHKRTEEHIEAIQKIRNCNDLEVKAKAWGYGCESTTKVPLLHLPEALQKLIHATPSGQCLTPMKADKELIVVMVCSKDAPSVTLPTKEQIRDQLMQERLSKIGMREFNKIRSIAFVEQKV
jgi:peptidyl-prolyl cis-trans isomerase SurA